MRDAFTFDAVAVRTEGYSLPGLKGPWAASGPPERVSALACEARELFLRLARPRGILEDISPEAFAAVYRGEGLNEPRTPVDEISTRAGRLALFVVTLGEEVSGEIARLFESRDFALGYVLDGLASESADRTAGLAARRYLDSLIALGEAREDWAALNYSPGYCGWHISGQRRLFDRLKPEEIRVRLNESFLMRPLKSVSGVIAAGGKEIHDFSDTFEFCSECEGHGCRQRIVSLGAARGSEREQWRS